MEARVSKGEGDDCQTDQSLAILTLFFLSSVSLHLSIHGPQIFSTGHRVQYNPVSSLKYFLGSSGEKTTITLQHPTIVTEFASPQGDLMTSHLSLSILNLIVNPFGTSRKNKQTPLSIKSCIYINLVITRPKVLILNSPRFPPLLPQLGPGQGQEATHMIPYLKFSCYQTTASVPHT